MNSGHFKTKFCVLPCSSSRYINLLSIFTTFGVQGTVRSARNTLDMICAGCGREYRFEDSFCQQCGALLPERAESPQANPPATNISSSSGLASGSAVPALSPYPEAVNPGLEVLPQSVSWPALALLVLLTIVSLSLALFCFILVAEARTFGKLLFFAVQSAGVALVAFWFCFDRWRRVASEQREKRKKFTRAALFISLMFLSVAGGMGHQLGTKRAMYLEMIRDWTHLQEVGGRISDKRNHVTADIPAYLAMYQSISGDVNDLQVTTARLIKEEERYRAEYSEYQANAEKEIAHLRITEQRAVLLQRQVTVAAKISPQNEQQRLLTWRQEMLPLLQQESALDEGN